MILLTSIVSFAGNKKIVVDLTKQVAYAYEGKKLVYKGWISSGQKEYPTPTGTFKVLEKEEEHVSNEWPKPDGGAKMPYMLRLTWTGIALHLGYTPNRPASHGCVRLKNGFAQKLFEWADVGTKVIIKGKSPKRVARRGSGFVDYIALAKKKKYKKSYQANKRGKKKKRYLAKKDKKSKKVYLAKSNKTKKRTYKAKKSKKKIYIAKNKKLKRTKVKYVSKRDKLVLKYARMSHKKLNTLLRQNKKQKRILLSSAKYSKNTRAKKLKEIDRLNSIIWAAKSMKYKKFKNKRLAKKVHRNKKLS